MPYGNPIDSPIIHSKSETLMEFSNDHVFCFGGAHTHSTQHTVAPYNEHAGWWEQKGFPCYHGLSTSQGEPGIVSSNGNLCFLFRDVSLHNKLRLAEIISLFLFFNYPMSHKSFSCVNHAEIQNPQVPANMELSQIRNYREIGQKSPDFWC